MDNMIYRRTKTVAVFKDKSQMDQVISELNNAGVYDIHTKRLGPNFDKEVKEEAFLTRDEITGSIRGGALGGFIGLVVAYVIASNVISPPLVIPASAGGIYVLLFLGLFTGIILGSFTASIIYMVSPCPDVKEGDYLLTVYYISNAKKKVIYTIRESLAIII